MNLSYPGGLHNHTDYSNQRLRDSTNRYNTLIDYAIELGHEVIAITEHESLSNHVKVEKYYNKIKQEHPDFKVILGNEIYLVRDDLTAQNFVSGEDRYFHFILLAKDEIGHRQLREISTRAWARSYANGKMTRVPTHYQDLIDIIAADPGHVIGSTACLGGFLPTKILKYKTLIGPAADEYKEKIITWCGWMQSIFGKNDFYFEMQPSHNADQVYVNKFLHDLSVELDIPYIITTDSHYLRKEDRPIHKAFLTSQEGDREVDEFYASTYMMSTEELESYFPYFTTEQLQIAYSNIVRIKEKCKDYSLLKPLHIPSLKWKIPTITAISPEWFTRIPNLMEFYESPHESDKILALAIVQKLMSDTRLQYQELYNEVNSNLDITWQSSEVNKARWSAYFLNLQNNIQVCWDAGTIVGPGRGSGVGFLLLYILDIIQINPLWEETRTYAWRFLNPERVSVLDIDTDIESARRPLIIQALKDYYGEDRVSNVITFHTEKSKSAIQTAARGLGIDPDIALYISSLIPADRGQTRTLNQCYYGDEEKDFKPIPAFVQAMKEYPEIWEVAQNIEGLICSVGEHAGGVIFVDEPFTNSCSLVKLPNGHIATAYDLHDAEDVGLIKIDLLSVNCLDKIHNCLDLLVEQGYVEPGETLKETYEKAIGIYNLERTDPKMWAMIWNHEVQDLFQMEKESGIQGIALIKPKNLNDLTVLNSVIRLMAPDNNSEQPLQMWARYRQDINQWYDEMRRAGLSADEIEWLSHHPACTDGVCESQEGLMSLVQDERLGSNSLTFADKCRKALAKKIGKLFDECQEEYYNNAKEKGCSYALVHYVWEVLLAPQRGYSFNRSHCLAYSLVGLQEMNLAFRYPTIIWSCACLIANSGGDELEDVKSKGAKYGKMAAAMGRLLADGIEIYPPDINESSYTFWPEVHENRILYGLKGIATVGDDTVKAIIENRPYISWLDFYNKVKPKKQSMIMLIKGGAFDSFQPRERTLVEFIWYTCDKKSRITLQNMPGLIRYGLLPEDTEERIMARRIYEFNRYLKAECKKPGDIYQLDTRSIDFLSEIGQEALIHTDNGYPLINAKEWDKIYQGWMNIFRDWIKSDPQGILDNLNTIIFMQDWEKYKGRNNLAAWEMEAICFYYHTHELAGANRYKYNISQFSDLPEEPEIDKIFYRGGASIPIYKLHFIVGTCIAKNKDKGQVMLLTTDGVVTVKFRKEYFALFDRQVFRKNPDGTKTVLERSWFNKGSMVLIQGIRRGDNFVPKKYSSSAMHQLYKIDDIKSNGDLELRSERIKGEEEDDEEEV